MAPSTRNKAAAARGAGRPRGRPSKKAAKANLVSSPTRSSAALMLVTMQHKAAHTLPHDARANTAIPAQAHSASSKGGHVQARMQGQREHRSAKASGPRKDWAAAPSTLSASVSRPNPSDRSVTPEPPVSIHSSMAEQQRETASPSSGWTVLEREGSSFVHAKRQALVSSAYVPEYEYPLSSVRQPSVAGPEEMLKPKYNALSPVRKVQASFPDALGSRPSSHVPVSGPWSGARGDRPVRERRVTGSSKRAA